MDKFRAQELREKSVKEGLSIAEMIEIVAELRSGRVSACFATKAAKAKKTKIETEAKKKLAEDLFSDLDNEENDHEFRI